MKKQSETPRVDAVIYPVACRDAVTGDAINVVHVDDARAIEQELYAECDRLSYQRMQAEEDRDDAIKRAESAERELAMLTILRPANIVEPADRYFLWDGSRKLIGIFNPTGRKYRGHGSGNLFWTKVPELKDWK